MTKISEISPKEVKEMQKDAKQKAGLCSEEKCYGTIDFATEIPLQTGCGGFHDVFYPCSKCGRIHDRNGSPVNNRAGGRAYLEHGEIVIK